MAWPIKSLIALISLPVFTVCALTLYYYHVKDKEWKKYLKNIQRQEIEIKIPLNLVGEVIGRGGETIRELQEKTQTFIKVKSCADDDKFRICKVFGSKENVEMARNLISEILNPRGTETIEFWVPTSSVGKVLGKNGDTINEIKRLSNAKVYLDRKKHRNSKELILIKGNTNEIEIARKLIDEKVKESQKSQPPRSPRIRPKKPKENGIVHNIPPYEEIIVTTPDNMPQVYVSSVETPEHFWIQLCSPRGIELDHLVDEMTDYYAKPENAKLHQLKEVREGQIVASKFQHDGKWYRVEVMSIEKNIINPEESTVDVFYVDYGDVSVYKIGELLELKPEYLHLKFQAIEVSMIGLKPKEKSWDDEASETFADMVYTAQWKALLAQVVCYKEKDFSYKKKPIPLIKLYDPDGPQGVDIGTQFIEKGYALRDETDIPEEVNNDDNDDDDDEKVEVEVWN